ncbi:MAG: sensor histidine kinase [Xanthomonadales bacterium]|nr:sensor histidine kinase [Xanthomonadales bacterium]
MNNGGFRLSLRDMVSDVAGRTVDAGPQNEAQAAIARILDAQEDTARRIAQSLHDEASQMLALVYLELANIARKSPKPTADRIDRVIQHLDSVCEQLRGLSHELHPMVLERHGLVPALHKLASGVSKRSGLAVRVVGEVTDLSPAIEVCIYRVAQEALSNVVRHAGARKAEIRLWQTEHRIHCSIRDDGVGYQPRELEAKGRYESGLGLVGIFERVDSLGGECHILSGGREGMELKLGIPI